MIPFPRMLAYGNTAGAVPVLTDIQGNVGNVMFLLYDDGRFYGIGKSGNLFGDGISATYTDWHPIRADVKNFWYGSGTIIIQTLDNKYYISAGKGGSIFFGSGLSTSTSWVECTSQMVLPSALPVQKMKLSLESGADYMFAIDEAGTLFSTGFAPNYCTGTGSNIAQGWKSVLTNVRDIALYSKNCTWAIKNDNTLYRCGINANYMLGTGSTTSTTLSTFTLFSTSFSIDDIRVKGTLVYFSTTTSGLVVLGTMTTGAAGNGVASANFINPTLVSGVQYDHLFDSPYQHTASTYMFDGSVVKYAGYSYMYGGVGNTTSANALSWTPVIGVPTIVQSTKLKVISGGAGSYILYDSKLYGTGSKTILYNYDTPNAYIYTFVPLPQPLAQALK